MWVVQTRSEINRWHRLDSAPRGLGHDYTLFRLFERVCSTSSPPADVVAMSLLVFVTAADTALAEGGAAGSAAEFAASIEKQSAGIAGFAKVLGIQAATTE